MDTFHHEYPFERPPNPWHGYMPAAPYYHGATNYNNSAYSAVPLGPGTFDPRVEQGYGLSAFAAEAQLADGSCSTSGAANPVATGYSPSVAAESYPQHASAVPFASPANGRPSPPYSDYSTSSGSSSESEEDAVFNSVMAEMVRGTIGQPHVADLAQDFWIPGPAYSGDHLPANPANPAGSLWEVLLAMEPPFGTAAWPGTQQSIPNVPVSFFPPNGMGSLGHGHSEAFVPWSVTNAQDRQTELAIEIENRYQLGPQFALAAEQTSSRLPERIGGLEQDRNSHYVNYDYNTQEQYIAPEPVSGTHPVGGTATFDATSETTGVTLPQPKQYKARRKNYKYECGICKEPYSVKKERDNHVYSVHKRCVGWQCPGYLKGVCSQKSFLSSWELHRHLLGETRKRCRVLAERKGWDASDSATCKVLRRTVPATM